MYSEKNKFYCICSPLSNSTYAKGKIRTSNTENQAIIDNLSKYSFVVKYWNGYEMEIADILSRPLDNDVDSPNEIIPTSFVKRHITRQ